MTKQTTCLDEIQQTLYTKFPKDSWLGNQKNIEHLLDWTTFYRRNIPLFIEHYFKPIKLHPYQVISIQEMEEHNSTDITAARASAKSWLLAIYACARCVLYPGTEVVIISSTKTQAGLIVTDKIEKMRQTSPNLRREISKSVTNNNDIHVDFVNTSKITVVPASENALGHRSNILIIEEARRVKKDVIDRIAKPFQIPLQPQYKSNPKYSHLVDESKTLYISSSCTSSEWFAKLGKDFMKGKYRDNLSCFLAMDLSVSLAHGIKTRAQLLEDKRTFDPITWRIEYENELLRENQSAFFSYKMLVQNQRLKKCFYPITTELARAKKKNPYDIPKQQDEVRLITCDFAFVDKKGNDNSAFSCIRLLPESVEYTSTSVDGKSTTVKRGYRRIVSYIEAFKGTDIDTQAIRIKQLFHSFNADYCVLDARNGGQLIGDRLAKVLYSEEWDMEFKPWWYLNEDAIGENRVRVAGAESVMFLITASQKLNSDIATVMRETLVSKRIDFLIDYNTAVDDLLSKIPEYTSAADADTMLYYERPYLETQSLISEMVALEYEVGLNTGVFKIFETGTNCKDRYTSVSYGNYFASLLEQDLLSESSEYEPGVFVN